MPDKALLAEDAPPSLLGAQDRQSPQQVTEEPATERQARAPRNLDGVRRFVET
jgi:hypothetical protein